MDHLHTIVLQNLRNALMLTFYCPSMHNFVYALHSLVSSEESIIRVTGRASWISFFIILFLFQAIKFTSKCIVPKGRTVGASVTR